VLGIVYGCPLAKPSWRQRRRAAQWRPPSPNLLTFQKVVAISKPAKGIRYPLCASPSGWTVFPNSLFDAHTISMSKRCHHQPC